jgi:hypothetical protein
VHSSGPKTVLTPFYFEVKAGSVTYLGNIQVKVTSLKNGSGRRYASTVRPTLENRYASAVADFHREYPALASLPIDNVAPEKFDLFPAGLARAAKWGGPANDYNQMVGTGPSTVVSGSTYSSVSGTAPAPLPH